jgi:uncharacterized Fe-S cluster protein YjdI
MSNKISSSELSDVKAGKEEVREYSNKDITVFWRPDRCIHSANCLIGLPLVFNNGRRPWIDIEGASSKEIIKTVNTCPSRALVYIKNSDHSRRVTKRKGKKTLKFARIQILKDGPILVSGNFIIRDSNKKKIRIESETVALCRCGVSKIKPLCDGNHKSAGFRAD